MLHPIYPICRRLALSLACVAAAAQGVSARDYSHAPSGGLASGETSGISASGNGRLVIAQAGDSLEGDARKKLRSELDVIRGKNVGSRGGAARFDPPLPVRKRAGLAGAETSDAAASRARTGAIDPKVDRLTGQILVFGFRGTAPNDPGAKAVRALLQSGQIAGVVFGRENIQSKPQLKELMKFFLLAAGANRPLFAIRQIGGVSDPFPAAKGFEQWPSEQDVADKGDPQYAYSTYRSMGASLAALGFNINLGPTLAAASGANDPGASFGNNPLQTGVFAKTFVLGHREENVVAIPIVDGSALSVRALKTMLVSDPALPISYTIEGGSDASPFSAYNGLVKGPRFCMVASGAVGAISSFKRGCDIVVLDAGAGSLTAVRDEIALGLSQAIGNGELSIDALNAAAARAGELRAPAQSGWSANAARSR